MKKILTVMVLAISLGGCATISNIQSTLSVATGFSIDQNKVDATRETYVAFLKGVAQYGAYPKCLPGQNFFTNGCHDAPTLKKLQGVKNSVRNGLADVQAKLNSGDSTGALAAFNTAKTALTTGQGILASFGIKAGA